MDPFRCYTYEGAAGHEKGFTRSQPQGYYRLINNIQRFGNLIYNYKLKLKSVLRHNSKIYDPPQGGKSSLEFLMLRCAEEAKLGDIK